MNSFFSPAKLNLFFRVLRKRDDGYHEIASLFQAIDLFDRLFISESRQDKLTCSDPQIACDDSNLVSKALALFRAQLPTPCFQIHIEKKIPIQAGLGGGSSNAATTLWMVNESMGRPFPLEKLIEMGAKIGSDVSFFFSKGTAYCTGRGEIFEPFQLPNELKGYLAKPHYGLSTPLVYQHVRIQEFLLRDPVSSLKNYPQFFNDLEIPAFHLEPRLKVLQERLQKDFETVVMTGSGTAFFCLNGNPTSMDGVTFYPFQAINRSNTPLQNFTNWYESQSI